MELGLGALGDIEAAELLHSPEQLAHLARVLQEHQEQHRGVVSLARGRSRRHVLGCVGPALQPLRTSWHVSGKKCVLYGWGEGEGTMKSLRMDCLSSTCQKWAEVSSLLGGPSTRPSTMFRNSITSTR